MTNLRIPESPTKATRVIKKSFSSSLLSLSLDAPVYKPKKLNISDVEWDNSEKYLRIFLPCQKSLDMKDVKYTVKYSEEDGSTQLTVTYPGHEFDVHVCKQILPDLEGKRKGRTLIIRLTKIYPRDHWSLLCSREYHSNGTITFYVNKFFKKTLTLEQIKPLLPSSPFHSLENIIIQLYNDSNHDIFILMLDEMILHEMPDKTIDSGYVRL